MALSPSWAVDGTDGFVTVDGDEFVIDGRPYHFVGVNLWYGAYLGSNASFGDRARLVAELDQLKEIGVDNLRILGASEASPFKRSLEHTFRTKGDEYNEALLEGLDFLLAEMRKRDMRAVIYLNNFWEWSGGMGTYLYWTNGGSFIDLGDPAHPWPAFPNFTAGFYESGEANALYRRYVTALVSRTNTVTGGAYRDDPTIMAWQLANEPRPAFNAREGDDRFDAFVGWIDETARFIKSLDPNHLVSSGNEGFMGCNEIDNCFQAAHRSPAIDYLTFHIWPRNWSWHDAAHPDRTFKEAANKTASYIERHIADAKALNKPIVLEEFGLDRDGEALSPDAPARFRDRFLRGVYAAMEADMAVDGPFAGTNVWSWGGAGRAAHEDFEWRAGDTAYTGDPPQEPQGRNSVFDTDVSTLEIMSDHAARLKEAR
ncbi:MAG: cellulase family glycosylhydrolase [Amphiplicatus sp.]